MLRFRYFTLFILSVALFSCEKSEGPEPFIFPQLMDIPPGFPEMEFPSDNKFSIERWELGKQLFFESALSKDSSLSCASCHEPGLAFSDKVSFSLGVENRLGTRNSPSLSNIGYHPYFTREGGVPTLEMQVLVPVQEHNEFDFNIVLIAERLKKDPRYVEMALLAYDREPDAFVVTRSLATFERTLISGNSKFDQYFYQGIQEALSPLEKEGMELFFSERTNCSSCHAGFNFTNYAFENNGLDEKYDDPGRFRLTLEPADSALFKVPSLRNIAVTGPYMHDGSIATLEEVIDHYNRGGANHPHKNSLLKPLGLTEYETSALKAFLASLTDQTFLENPLFKK
ncbi:MAG: cytochrome-c peroxidase [Saprospiraceae bacterium]|nr:cytochrome-c peroxidase [Saprospiraceae bacterium]